MRFLNILFSMLTMNLLNLLSQEEMSISAFFWCLDSLFLNLVPDTENFQLANDFMHSPQKWNPDIPLSEWFKNYSS